MKGRTVMEFRTIRILIIRRIRLHDHEFVSDSKGRYYMHSFLNEIQYLCQSIVVFLDLSEYV